VRSSLICVLFLLTFSLVFVCKSYSQIDPTNVVGLWLFEEGNGKVAKDSSGNGNDGNFAGDGAKWVDAKYGKGLQFDGTGWLECGNGPSLDFSGSTNFSVHAIVNAEKSDGRCIIWKGLGCSSWSQWFLGTGAHENGDNSTSPEFHIRLANGGDRKFVRGNNPLPEGEWVQVAGTYDGSQLKVYVDGELANTADVEGNPWASPEQVYIAADPGCDGRCQWTGIIDEIAVFNVTLSDADIRALANGYEGFSAVSSKEKLVTTWGYLKSY